MTEKYFKIISAPSFLDAFIKRAFVDAGFSPATDDNAGPTTAIYVAGQSPEKIDNTVYHNTVVIIQPGTVMPAIDAKATVIRTPYVVGTGMQGKLRDLVAMVGRGTMFFIEGNLARVSVVHAIDIANLSAKLADTQGDFTVADGIDPTWNDLIEALSRRVGHKRISTVSPRSARWLALVGKLWGGPDKAILKVLSTDATVSPSQLPLDYKFINTVDYLTHHQYTDEDI